MLSGIRVVEFGQYVAGPATGMLLADLGASVIKIERPGGDPLAGWPAYHVWNRGKRILRADLATAAGREQAHRLASEADVVIDSLRPGSLAGFGLGLEELRRERPGLIGVRFNGFHPEMEGMPAAWEPIIGALGGTMRPAKPLDVFAEPGITYTPIPIASNFAALHAATDVLAALFARGAGASGSSIEVDISGALYTGLCSVSVFVNGRPAKVGRFPGHPVDGDPYESVINGQTAMYVCGDGSRLMLWASGKETRRFLEALEVDPESDEAGEPWTRETLRARLGVLFASRSALEWEAMLADRGFTAIRLRTTEEWLAAEHARAAALVVEVETALGTMWQPGGIVRAAGQETAPAKGPVLVESADELAWPERGASASVHAGAEIARSGARPLAGVRVLDLSIVLAGPTTGRILAELGAEVIKVENPRRPMIERAWLDVNRGKSSIALDLETDGGREVLWRLIDQADVLLENFRSGVMGRLGLDYRRVADRNPKLVYASFNAFGWGGPLSDLPGWEQYAQAITGIQLRNGGRDGDPRLSTFLINDYGTGIAGALGVIAALHERRASGAGKHVLGALTATAGFHQAIYMVDFDGHERHEIEGADAVGTGALSRLYRCADGPAYLHASERQLPELLACAGLEGTDADGDDLAVDSALAAKLEERLVTAPAASWARRFARVGVAFAPARTIPEFITDEAARAVGHLATSIVPGYGRVDTVGSCSRFDGESPEIGVAGMPGADAVAILRALGYDEREIADLFVSGVVQSCAEASAPQQTETAGV